jgi:arylsulfatase A-like enzyme
MGHNFCLYNSLLHVPLIIRYPPKVQPGQVIKERVSTIFLFQTVLDLIGIESKTVTSPIEKRSLFDNSKQEIIYSEYGNAITKFRRAVRNEAPADFDFDIFDKRMKCIYAGEYKFIWSSNGYNELYNISVDWNENENILSIKPKKARDLNEKLKSWHASLEKHKNHYKAPE